MYIRTQQRKPSDNEVFKVQKLWNRYWFSAHGKVSLVNREELLLLLREFFPEGGIDDAAV